MPLARKNNKTECRTQPRSVKTCSITTLLKVGNFENAVMMLLNHRKQGLFPVETILCQTARDSIPLW
ncbi:hypothetical protein CHM34_07820 [Paludifilum halophilum]|uniref:Uncharacterized protein n=1 Tax=Paludifilum halophilum TaxID=1642702 RepID=A0A235B6T9_9BACL|nr:hypothetical protein CHM34_07820 [Paludifilum halophilum]